MEEIFRQPPEQTAAEKRAEEVAERNAAVAKRQAEAEAAAQAVVTNICAKESRLKTVECHALVTFYKGHVEPCASARWTCIWKGIAGMIVTPCVASVDLLVMTG